METERRKGMRHLFDKGRKLAKQLLLKDIELFKYIYNKFRSRSLDWIMTGITFLGGTIVSIAVPVSLLVFGNHQFAKLGWELGIVLLLGQLLVQVIKHLTSRPRPSEVLKDMPLKQIIIGAHSFPSGHTTAGFSQGIVWSFYFPDFSPVFVLVAILIGMSRIYLGRHYPLDVLTGVLIALMLSFSFHFGFFG
jgi:undecaprenyl-diphosphatase